MVSSFAGVTIKVLLPQGRRPWPEPVGTPVVRTPNLGGGSNVQVVGYRGRAVTLTLEWPSFDAYQTFCRDYIGVAGLLRMQYGPNDASDRALFNSTVLETVSGPSSGRDRRVQAQARFTMDGY